MRNKEEQLKSSPKSPFETNSWSVYFRDKLSNTFQTPLKWIANNYQNGNLKTFQNIAYGVGGSLIVLSASCYVAPIYALGGVLSCGIAKVTQLTTKY